MKAKKSEQLLARAALWRARADVLEAEAMAAHVQEAQDAGAAERRALEAVEAKLGKGVNDWSAPRIRSRMATVRELQREWLKLDDIDHARALDILFNQLRVRAEGIERQRIENEVSAEGWCGAEAKKRIEARWEEHRRKV
jgi:hypothetical protein